MIIRKGDRLVVALSSDGITANQATVIKQQIREAMPELAGVILLTGVSGMAVVPAGENRCPTCNEARQLVAGWLDPEDDLPCIDRWHTPPGYCPHRTCRTKTRFWRAALYE